MKFRLIPFLTPVFFFAPPLSLHGEEKIKESPYYPLKVGTKWTYRAGKNQITAQVVGHDKVGEIMCAVVETVKEGQPVTSEHIAAKEDGIYRYAFGYQKIDPPICFLKLPPKKGDIWKIESKIGGGTAKAKFTLGEEEITVRGRKFKTVTSGGDLEVNNQTISFTYWFAENVGMVKQIIKVDKKEIVIELVKFE